MKGEVKIDLGEYKVELIHNDNGHLKVTILDELGEPIETVEISNDDE